ncbi:type VI secretion system protein TssA [Ideonella sp. BN130291]|uniref:type VI secretion system protein TssA n=1 Tax=Ideonella sp. BN130291 TaxID=3112940 RepID=UPI002E252C2D|nr:type VI secretion system protein TssA [Ideonella sp. BN130291]
MSALLSPLSSAAPCGDDLSFSPEFDHIQELRRADDPTLDQGEWVTALKSADWPAVVAQCDALLKDRTKDLRLLVWRVEALAQVKGYPGLAQGLEDCVQVCEAFWDGLHPLPDGGDMEQRAGSIRWLLAQLQRLARSLPVTSAPSGRFTLAQMDEARQLQMAIERDPDHAAALGEGKVTLAQVQRARSDTPAAFLRANVAAMAVARTQLQVLQALMDPRLGDEGPSFVHARQALDDAYHAVEKLARDAGVITEARSDSAADEAQSASGDPSSGAARPTGTFSASGEPTDRAQALRQLRVVADFFRRTEPHSPVALLADKAARWGEMPLEQWLREVIKDPSSLGHLEELLGMKPPADPAG